MKKLKKHIFLIALLVLFLSAGIFSFVIRRYANIQYNNGIAAIAEEDYESAYTYFHSAMKWDCSEDDLSVYYGYAAYMTEDYETCASQYETLTEYTDEQILQLHESYLFLADEALDNQNETDALDYLTKDYELYPTILTELRIEALNNGSAEDRYGDTVNAYGRITSVYIDEETSVEVVYNEGQFSSLTCGDIVFDDFDYDGSEYTITWQEGTYTVSRSAYDDNENLISQSTITETDSQEYTYTYTYDKNDEIMTMIVTDEEGEVVSTWTYLYEDGNVIEKQESKNGEPTGTYTVYTYDDEDNLINETTYENLTDEIKEVQYTYDGSMLSQAIVITTDSVEVFHYKNENDTCLSVNITDNKGQSVGHGVYIEDAGWIIVYTDM